MKTLFYSTCLFILLSIIGGIITYAVNHTTESGLLSGGYTPLLVPDITK